MNTDVVKLGTVAVDGSKLGEPPFAWIKSVMGFDLSGSLWSGRILTIHTGCEMVGAK